MSVRAEGLVSARRGENKTTSDLDSNRKQGERTEEKTLLRGHAELGAQERETQGSKVTRLLEKHRTEKKKQPSFKGGLQWNS